VLVYSNTVCIFAVPKLKILFGFGSSREYI
jgi:hypothetical protein